MSKKRFTDGLESLFGAKSESENLPEESPLLIKTEVKVVAVSSKKKTKSRTNKNFTSDLDSLFEDALQETIEEKMAEHRISSTQTATTNRNKKSVRRPVSGLDALIRRTIEGAESEISYEKRKRVTFVFEKNKVEKLKQIAKMEKTYLKDILGDIVEEYIKKFENKKGTLT